MFVQGVSSNKAIDNYQIVEHHWMLPEDFRVYVNGDTVGNHPIHGFDEKILPTFNHYKGGNGGYVAIYTNNAERGVYRIGGDIYVMGQVRIEGEYVGRIFIPVGYKSGDNITQDPAILAICDQYFPDMKGEMWVSGDTGGWFGIAGVAGNPSNVWSGVIPSWEYDDWGTEPLFDDEGWPIHRDWD